MLRWFVRTVLVLRGSRQSIEGHCEEREIYVAFERLECNLAWDKRSTFFLPAASAFSTLPTRLILQRSSNLTLS